MNNFFRRPQLPVIPSDILRRYHVADPKDTRFASSARLLQSIWRERQGYEPGTFVDDAGEIKTMGSLLPDTVAQKGANFLSPDIARFARRDTAYREIGALVDDRRLWTNLLSSHPLTYNLFAPLRLVPMLATEFFKALLPDFVVEVLDMAFEHAPARGDLAFTGDRTAFDLIAVVKTANDQVGFVAIEVKYSENPTGISKPSSQRLDDLSAASGFYRDNDSRGLRNGPEQQFWREHLLCYSMIGSLPYKEARFLVVHPGLNHEVVRVIEQYRTKLTDTADILVGFHNRTLEECIAILANLGQEQHSAKLTERYLDFSPIERLIIDWNPETHQPG